MSVPVTDQSFDLEENSLLVHNKVFKYYFLTFSNKELSRVVEEEVNKLVSDQNEDQISFDAAKQVNTVMTSILDEIDQYLENQIFPNEVESDLEAQRKLELEQEIKKCEAEYEVIQSQMLNMLNKIDQKQASITSKLQNGINNISEQYIKEATNIDSMNIDKENTTVKIEHPETGKLFSVIFYRYLESMKSNEEKYTVQIEAIQELMDSVQFDKSNELNYHVIKTHKELQKLDNAVKNKALIPDKYEAKMLQFLNNSS